MPDTVKTDVEFSTPAVNVSQPENSAPLPSFEVFRFRHTKGSGDMYDPSLDILKIFPVCMNSTMEVLDSIVEQDDELYQEGCKMTHDIYTLFEIRLQEEQLPINEVLSKFMEVLHKYPERLVHMFEEVLFINLMVTYGVASRRLEGEIQPVIKEHIDDVTLATILSLVEKPTAAAVRKDLAKVYHDNLKRIDTPPAEHTVSILDNNGNIILENAKHTVAKQFRVKNGDQNWDTVASIVDQRTKNDNLVDEAYRHVYEPYSE